MTSGEEEEVKFLLSLNSTKEHGRKKRAAS
jgi:hypothetical protein